jgi:hypothetical protein
MRIVFKERLGVAKAKVLRDYGVDFGRGHAGCDDLAHELVRLPDTNAGLAHQRDFTFRFKLNHGELRSMANYISRPFWPGGGPVSTQVTTATRCGEMGDYVVQLR